MTVGKKLMTVIVAMLVSAAALGYVGLRSIGIFQDLFDNTVQKTVQKIVLADAIGAANAEMVSGQRGLILAAFAKDPVEADKYRTGFDRNAAVIRSSLAQVQPLLTSEEARRLAADIAGLEAEWQPHFRDVVRQTEVANLVEANRIRKETTAPIYNKIAGATQRLAAIENENLRADQESVAAVFRGSRWISLALLGLALIVGGAAAAVVRKTHGDLSYVGQGPAEWCGAGGWRGIPGDCRQPIAGAGIVRAGRFAPGDLVFQ